MDTPPMLAAIVDRLRAVAGLDALFLSGSHGRGEADAWSDLDLLAVVEPGAGETVASALNEVLAPVVIWRRHGPGPTLVNAITDDWQRVDLLILPADTLARYARDALRPLHDPRGLHATLPATQPPRAADPARVAGMIEEFIRILGLTPVVLGRGELVVAVAGAGMQRDLLQRLMLERVTLADQGGLLHLSRLLSPEDIAVLAALPYPRPDREEVIDAHLATARAFMPRARALAAELGVEWPAAFEQATRAHLRAALPERDVDWG